MGWLKLSNFSFNATKVAIASEIDKLLLDTICPKNTTGTKRRNFCCKTVPDPEGDSDLDGEADSFS